MNNLFISKSTMLKFQRSVMHSVATGTSSVGTEDTTTTSLLWRLLCDGHDVDGDRVEAHALEQVLGVGVDIELAGLGVLCEIKGGDFGDVLILSLTLFFLQLERDTAHRTALNALHQVGSVAGNLGCVSQRVLLGWSGLDDGPYCEGAWMR